MQRAHESWVKSGFARVADVEVATWLAASVCTCQPNIGLLPEGERDRSATLRTPRFFFLHSPGMLVRF